MKETYAHCCDMEEQSIEPSRDPSGCLLCVDGRQIFQEHDVEFRHTVRQVCLHMCVGVQLASMDVNFAVRFELLGLLCESAPKVWTKWFAMIGAGTTNTCVQPPLVPNFLVRRPAVIQHGTRVFLKGRGSAARSCVLCHIGYRWTEVR